MIEIFLVLHSKFFENFYENNGCFCVISSLFFFILTYKVFQEGYNIKAPRMNEIMLGFGMKA